MVFSSAAFIYFFLPITAVAYFIIPNRIWKNVVLWAASLGFYAWGEPKFVIIMLLAVLAAYIGGLCVHYFEQTSKKGLKRFSFIVTVVLLVGNLFIFKYLNFAVDNLNLLGLDIAIPQIILPIGISFYTFQILSYVIDLYWGHVEVQKNPLYLCLYLSFFPQLIAGPIVRYQTVAKEIGQRHETMDDVEYGTKRFIRGLAKKVLLANNIALIAEIIYAGDPAVYGTAMYWLAAVAYSLQIYFDFSGYSDMAIGLGRIFGFHFLENFDHPYTSLSITEFWRRWHISLSSWFRDYIYIPLGGNRVKKSRWIINILIVWGLTGFWHGAQWNFFFWGIYYGVLLLLEKLFLAKYLERLPKVLRWLYAMIIVVIGWVLFNLTEPDKLLDALTWMFTWHPTNWIDVIAADTDILFGFLWIPLGLIFMLPIREKCHFGDSVLMKALGFVVYGAIFFVCIIFVISSSYNPFIYFRF